MKTFVENHKARLRLFVMLLLLMFIALKHQLRALKPGETAGPVRAIRNHSGLWDDLLRITGHQSLAAAVHQKIQVFQHTRVIKRV